MYNTKSIRGTSSLTINIDNDDVNQSYNTVSANSLTSTGAVYANTTVNLLDLINTKQDAVTTASDLNVNSLDIDSASGTNVLNFDSGSQASITGTSGTLTIDIGGAPELTLTSSIATFTSDIQGDNITATADINADNANFTGDIGCSRLTVNSSATVANDFTVNTNVFHVDTTNDRVGVNTNSPGSALVVLGARDDTPAEAGVHMGKVGINDYGIEICSTASTGYSSLQFTEPNTDKRGIIGYDNSLERLEFYANNGLKATMDTSEFNLQSTDLTTTGDVTGNTFNTSGGGILNDNQFTSGSTTLDLMTSESTDYTMRIIKTSAGNGLGFSLQSQGMAVINPTETIRLDKDVECVQDLSVTGTITSNLDLNANDLTTTGNISCDDVITSGNLGVGKTPVLPLDVVGNGHITGNLTIDGVLSSSLDLQDIYDNSNSNPKITIGIAEGEFQFKSNSSVPNTLTILNQSDVEKFSVSNEGNLTCENLTVNGSLTTNQSLQDIYDNNDVEPHITVAASHPVTFQANAAVTNVFQCRNSAGTNKFEVSKDGDLSCQDLNINGNSILMGVTTLNSSTTVDATLTVNNGATFQDDITCNTNAFFVDASTKRVGIGTSAPTSALVVQGQRENSPSIPGVHMGYSGVTPFDYGLEVCSDSTKASLIDFTDDTPTDYRCRMVSYSNHLFEIVNSGNNDFKFNNGTGNTWWNTGFMGIGQATPTGSEKMNVNGDLTVQGDICCDSLCVNGTNGVISDRQFTSATTFLDLCTSNASDFTHRFIKETSLGNGIGGTFTSQGVTGIDATQWIELKKDVVISSGKTLDANLNSTRGQLLYIQGEENASLNVGSYDFNYGNGANSDSTFGMMVPAFTFKLKKFCYGGGNGSAPSTSTRYVFRLHVNGTGQAIYAYCDFSDTTHGSTAFHRFSNKFSSSSTSQVDIEPEITGYTYGTSLAWETITLTSPSTDTRHRFSIVLETTENL